MITEQKQLRQVVQIVCAQLDGSLGAEDREILAEDLEYFVVCFAVPHWAPFGEG
jgi:hypothetical protein